MARITPIAYNTGSPIIGTTQYGNLAVGDTAQDYGGQPGGVTFWSSPDLDSYYVIAKPVPAGNQPNPLDIPAYVAFNASPISSGTENFVNLVNAVTGQNFTGGTEAKIWLETNGFWTNYDESPVPTPSVTPTNTTTPTSTPTPTPTPTGQDNLINPIITENNEYIKIGNDEYLMFTI